MRTLLSTLLLSLTVACATVHTPRPASFGFLGRQCQPVRVVNCVPDADMSSSWCYIHTDAAIRDINRAAGRIVLALGPDIEATADAVEAAAHMGNIILWADKLSPGELGVTHYAYVKDEAGEPTDCIGVALVRVEKSVVSGENTEFAMTVVVHELLHAIGAGHVMQPSIYPTVMAPAPNLPWGSPNITLFDANALHGMYGE